MTAAGLPVNEADKAAKEDPDHGEHEQVGQDHQHHRGLKLQSRVVHEHLAGDF